MLLISTSAAAAATVIGTPLDGTVATYELNAKKESQVIPTAVQDVTATELVSTPAAGTTMSFSWPLDSVNGAIDPAVPAPFVVAWSDSAGLAGHVATSRRSLGVTLDTCEAEIIKVKQQAHLPKQLTTARHDLHFHAQ